MTIAKKRPPQRGHKRFVGGTVYCPRMERRYNLGLDHAICDEFVCPGCNVRIQATPQRFGR